MRHDDLIHFCPPARTIVGWGARHQLPALLQRLGWRRGLLVTDRHFSQNTPWVREHVEAAAALGIETRVIDTGLPDPSTTLCDETTAAVRASGAPLPDHVIGLGGGSNLDLAKALCLTLPGGRPVREFIGDLAGCRPLPMVAVPTTAGTASEATPGAILVDPHNATKVAVMDNALRPQVALIDPELSASCPPRVTGDAGIDAFTHAVESWLTIDSGAYDRAGHPDPGYSGRSSLTMMFARESARLCIAWMEAAYLDGGNRDARVGMAYASLYAGLSYGSAGLNAVHGTAYAVAGLTHRSHGSTNAVMLPYVLDVLRDTRRAELLELGAMLGVDRDAAGLARDEEAVLRAVPVAVRAMVGRLDIPTDLRGFGIAESDLPQLLRDALAVTRLAKALPVADVEAAYARIVRSAWEGRLSGDAH